MNGKPFWMPQNPNNLGFTAQFLCRRRRRGRFPRGKGMRLRRSRKQ